MEFIKWKQSHAHLCFIYMLHAYSVPNLPICNLHKNIHIYSDVAALR